MKSNIRGNHGNIIANADDLGLSKSINLAILKCFENGYINSTSLLTNTIFFSETLNFINENPCIQNIGVHVNLMEGKPVSTFDQLEYLDGNGNWNGNEINKKFNVFNKAAKAAFVKEISMQVDKALSAKLLISHLDSHYHLHTLPCFFSIFLDVAKTFKLKLRLAQTYNEGNYVNYGYRLYINSIIKKYKINYSDYFVTVEHLLNNQHIIESKKPVEVMLHPDLDIKGSLIDHFDQPAMTGWINFLK